jgi:phosphate acetyltransferase
MGVLEKSFENARANPVRVVFPEAGEDARIDAAVTRLRGDGLAVPVPLADPDDAQLAALLAVRPMKEALARRMLNKPLIRAAAMVSAGQAGMMVAGAVAPTRRVIEAASIAIGLAPGVTLPSSFFLMVYPRGRELDYAECAGNVAPEAAGLAAIARAAGATGTALFGQARVAMLSFSTGSSGTGASVETVRAAAALAGDVTGPVQADAALNTAIAHAKGINGGDANVLVFPSLDAGNIAYKLAQELAGARAVGPFLQGFARPVCDLSRGARVDDIVAAVVIGAGLA